MEWKYVYGGLGAAVSGITGLGSGFAIFAYVVAGILAGVLVGLLVEGLDDKLGFVGPGWTYGVALMVTIASGAWGWQEGSMTSVLYATLGFGVGIPIGLIFGWLAQ